MKRILACLAGLAVFAGTASAQTVREVITFLSEDGTEAIQYEGFRSDWGAYNLYYEKDKTLDDYLYFFPNAYEWDRSDPNNDIIRLRQGDYSFISQSGLDGFLTLSEDGLFTFNSAPDADTSSDRYGFWNSPQDFDKFVYSWVVPETIEIVDMSSNRAGEWVRRNNAVAWFGEDVNNVSFEITYRFRSASTMGEMEEALGGTEGVTLGQEAGGVRVTLANELLFASGSAALTEEGLSLIGSLAGAVDFSDGKGLIVEGHTDNVPIQGALTESFATNWELSAARALSVVKALQAAGAPPEHLEARAFGEYRPVADNATAAGRAQNRRISILISNP